ncbi:putative nuclease HARBI1 [Gigaspora margarita]|uniref:Putative nuclease HARBI1 n=1 Tax=Gigaspora margarita TaxID=4874 RepID=A0A8H4AIK5_GIGMA|nr:putative nuclease HARBI1 [Gigaspora margarita]
MHGSHIPIHTPFKNGSQYITCKNFHSINLLGVVDHQGHTILNHEIMLHPEQWVPGGTYIIANLVYPLWAYLIKPFPNYNSLGHRVNLLPFEDIEVYSELEYENQNDIENNTITDKEERMAGS